MLTSKIFTFGCLLVVVAVSDVAADWPIIILSNNDVYPADSPMPRPDFSKTRARNMSETTDLREFIMKYVQDPRICSDPWLRDLILAEDGSDERAKVWWSRRCGGRRGGGPRYTPSKSPESSPNDSKKWEKIKKMMKDKRLTCKPKKKAVPLPNPDHPTTKLQPECVFIKQCGGCCNSAELECLPVRTKTRTFPTMELTPSGESFQFQSNKIKMVKVVEHKSCSCQCKVRPEHCTPNQVYVEEACQCQCPSDLSRNCPSRKIWNVKTCRCECANHRKCPTGRFFDVNMCRCAAPHRV